MLPRPSIAEMASALLTPHRCLNRLSIARPLPRIANRALATTTAFRSGPKRSTDRGPASTEDTQTDFGALNVLGNTPVPTTSIDACLHDGFHLNNGLMITGGAGALLVGGEAFAWKPWGPGGTRVINAKGQFEVGDEAWGLLGLVWPKPGMCCGPLFAVQ